MTYQDHTNSYRTTARVVGVLILTATISYMLGSGILDSLFTAPDYLAHLSATGTQVILGALLKFAGAAANVSIGIVIFHLLRKHSETIAIGYVATRIFDGVGVMLGGIAALSLLALSRQTVQGGAEGVPYALALGNLIMTGSDTMFIVTMMALGLGSIPFCYLLFRTRLVPRPLAALGFAGYVALLVGSALELTGLDLQMLHYVPGGLFELILPLWLIAKGFNATAAPAAAKNKKDERLGLSQA